MAPAKRSPRPDSYVEATTIGSYNKDIRAENQKQSCKVSPDVTVHSVSPGALSGQGSASSLKSPQFAYKYHPGEPQHSQSPIMPASCPMTKRIEESMSSRIPRAPTIRQPQGTSTPTPKGARSTPEHRSSIPIAVHRGSEEKLGSTNAKAKKPPTGEIRMVERPRGPRLQPFTEYTNLRAPESAQKAVMSPRPLSTSSSSKESETFEIDNSERPPTVFTGEYRTRFLTRPGRQNHGPTLKIASSAEDIIMGSSIRGRNDSISRRMGPASVNHLDNPALVCSKAELRYRGSPTGSNEASGINNSIERTHQETPIVRNFCRPQVSFESLARNEFDSKQSTIARKPVNSPSLGNLCCPSTVSLRSDYEAFMPKHPTQYNNGQGEDVPLLATRAEDPMTLARSVSEPMAVPFDPEATPMPKTAEKVISINLHPPRKSSLKVLSNAPVRSGIGKSPDALVESYSKPVPNLRRNITFSDAMPQDVAGIHAHPPFHKAQVSESKGNNILGSFRNIFKSRTLSTDKGRGKKEDIDISITTKEEPFAGSDLSTAYAENTTSDPDKTPKPRPRYTKLSSSVSWNRSSRSSRTSDDLPAVPSVPRLQAPSNRLAEARTPSFARPTKSTRTKATFGLGVRTPIGLENRVRRTHVRTGSTGSPQRLHHAPHRPNTPRSPHSVVAFRSRSFSGQNPALADGPLSKSPSTHSPRNIHRCLEALYKRVAAAATEAEREKYIRLALKLQQQLGDFSMRERMAVDAEAWAKEKQREKNIAEDSLNASIFEVQGQLGQE